jgi:cell division protein FtsL
MPRIPATADALGFAVRKDVRNNLVRQVDRARHREMWETAAVLAAMLLIVLMSVWERTRLLNYGYQIERLRAEQNAEEAIGRRLRLEIETLRSPARIEDLAKREIGMVVPPREDVIILERVTQPAPASKSLVASR